MHMLENIHTLYNCGFDDDHTAFINCLCRKNMNLKLSIFLFVEILFSIIQRMFLKLLI